MTSAAGQGRCGAPVTFQAFSEAVRLLRFQTILFISYIFFICILGMFTHVRATGNINFNIGYVIADWSFSTDDLISK